MGVPVGRVYPIAKPVEQTMARACNMAQAMGLRTAHITCTYHGTPRGTALGMRTSHGTAH